MGSGAGRSTRSLERTMMAPHTPPQVRRAIYLLWLSLGLATLGVIAEWQPAALEDRSLALEIGLLMALMTLFQAALIYLASRRRNWARIVLLLVLFLGGITMVIFPGEGEPWWYWVSVLC